MSDVILIGMVLNRQVLCQSTLVGTRTRKLILQRFVFLLLATVDLDTRMKNEAITRHYSNTTAETADGRKH